MKLVSVKEDVGEDRGTRSHMIGCDQPLMAQREKRVHLATFLRSASATNSCVLDLKCSWFKLKQTKKPSNLSMAFFESKGKA